MRKLGFDLVLLGAPAAGKNTQAERLLKRYALKPIETGKYLRSLMGKKGAVSDKLRSTTGKGNPAPVSLIKDFLKKNIENSEPGENLLFIGNPRLKPEAQYLRKLLVQKGRDFFVIYITLPDAEILKRSIARNQNRSDDDKKCVKNRIDYHRNQVSKTIGFFRKIGKLKLVNGKDSVGNVTIKINKILDDYQRSQRG